MVDKLKKILDYNIFVILIPIITLSGLISTSNLSIAKKSNVSITDIDILDENLFIAFLVGLLTPILATFSSYIFLFIWFKIISFNINLIDLLKASILGYLPLLLISIVNVLLNLTIGYKVEGYTGVFTIIGGVDVLNILGFIFSFYLLYLKFNFVKRIMYWGTGLFIIFMIIISSLT